MLHLDECVSTMVNETHNLCDWPHNAAMQCQADPEKTRESGLLDNNKDGERSGVEKTSLVSRPMIREG